MCAPDRQAVIYACLILSLSAAGGFSCPEVCLVARAAGTRGMRGMREARFKALVVCCSELLGISLGWGNAGGGRWED